MGSMKTAAFATAIVFLLAAPQLSADSSQAGYLWDNPSEVRVLDSKIAFSHTKYDHAKNESIFILAYFNDGWVLMYSLFHLDTALFDRWGMYALIAEPDGTHYWKTHTVSERNIEISEERLYYADGDNLIDLTEDTLSLRCDFDGFTCDLLFDKYMPSWKPGTGREEYTEGGEYFQFKAVFLPRSSVKGIIDIDGMTVYVAGDGYGEKTLFVNPLTRHQPYLHALRLYSPVETPRSDSWHIGIHQVMLNEDFGNREIPRLVVARGDEWIFTTREYTFEPLDTGRVDEISYQYGTKFLLHGEKGGYILDGIVEERVFFHFTDVFESLPGWFRKILSVFFKRPVYFRYVADFAGTITAPDGSQFDLEMSGPYEYVVVY
jgi:hypothetical protein